MRSFLPLVALRHLGARLDLARVDRHEGQLAEERVSRNLEGQGRERLVLAGLADQFPSSSSPTVAVHLADVQRVGR